VTPRLASWNRNHHPDQVRLKASLEHAADVLAPSMRSSTKPLALRMDVGLPAATALLDQHDLDNYLYPLPVT
jgi:hypothetical protein